MASSSLYDQYGLMSVYSSSLVLGQPVIIKLFDIVTGHPVWMAAVFVIWTHTLGCLLQSYDIDLDLHILDEFVLAFDVVGVEIDNLQ